MAHRHDSTLADPLKHRHGGLLVEDCPYCYDGAVTPPKVDPLILGTAVGAILVVLAFLLFAGPARAHSWYDPICCSSNDCVEIGKDVPGKVTVTRSGYAVHLLYQGEEIRFIVPQSEAKPSQDENFHACLMPTPGAEQPYARRCFYAPPLGA